MTGTPARGYGGKQGVGGRRPDLDNRYFRSMWEANYARYLDWLVAHGQLAAWAYEPDTFEFTAIRRGTRFYTPDFRLLNLDLSTEYHEVKGWMDAKSRTQLARMARYYPAVKVVVVDADAYYAIARQVGGRLIPGWEHAAATSKAPAILVPRARPTPTSRRQGTRGEGRP